MMHGHGALFPEWETNRQVLKALNRLQPLRGSIVVFIFTEALAGKYRDGVGLTGAQGRSVWYADLFSFRQSRRRVAESSTARFPFRSGFMLLPPR